MNTPTPPSDPRQRIARFLDESGPASRVASVAPITGDASDRRYFRVFLRDGATQVLAVHPGPIDFARLPFANVARLLAAMPVPAPRILGHSDPFGIIALEDLGDVTLQARLGAALPAERAALYRQAVELIVTLQHRGADLASADYAPYGLAFDEEKLTWELQFFTEHFLEAYRGAALTVAEREALAREYAAIARELASERRVLCHRDYHSRNLMVHGGGLHIIDFQDARMGPDTYDLASLLRDSYVDLSEPEVGDLIALFLAQPARGGMPAGGAVEFRRRFDLMSLQRNLKALGTFGCQAAARGNPAYIQYVPRTLACARANLRRYPRFERLHELLASRLRELE